MTASRCESFGRLPFRDPRNVSVPSAPGCSSNSALSLNHWVICSGSVTTDQTTSIGASIRISRS